MICYLLSDAVATQTTNTQVFINGKTFGSKQPKTIEISTLNNPPNSLTKYEKLPLVCCSNSEFIKVIEDYKLIDPNQFAKLLAEKVHYHLSRQEPRIEFFYDLMGSALEQTKEHDNNKLIEIILANYKNDNIFLSYMVGSLTDPEQIQICADKLGFAFTAKNIYSLRTVLDKIDVLIHKIGASSKTPKICSSFLRKLNILLDNFKSSEPDEIITFILTIQDNDEVDNALCEKIVTKYKDCDSIFLAVVQQTNKPKLLDAIVKTGGAIPCTLEYIAKNTNHKYHAVIAENDYINLATCNFIAQETCNMPALEKLAQRIDKLAERLQINHTELLLKIFSNPNLIKSSQLSENWLINKERDLLILAQNPNISPKVLQWLIGKNDSEDAYAAIIKRCNSDDADLLSKIARLTKSKEVLQMLVAHPHVDDSTLEALDFNCADKITLTAIIEHQCTSNIMFKKLLRIENLDADLLRLIITKLQGLVRATNGRHEALFIQTDVRITETSDSIIKVIQEKLGNQLQQIEDKYIYIYDVKAQNPNTKTNVEPTKLLCVLIHNGKIYNNYIKYAYISKSHLEAIKKLIKAQKFLHITLTPEHIKYIKYLEPETPDDPIPDQIIKNISMAVSQLNQQDKTINEPILESKIAASEAVKLELDIGTYVGTVSQGKPHGSGKMLYKNGDSYEGEWKHGLEHGKGKAVYQNGDSYEGEWYFGFEHDNSGEYTQKSTGHNYKSIFRHGRLFYESIFMAMEDSKKQSLIDNYTPRWLCTCVERERNTSNGQHVMAANIIQFTILVNSQKRADEICEKTCEKSNMRWLQPLQYQ